MKYRVCYIILSLITAVCLSGCGAAIVGGAGYAGYKGATDERSIGTIMDDTVISTTVKTKLISDEFVKARHIDVDVLNGVVYLIGVVESSSQKRMAGDIARGVDGVNRVQNQLSVGKTTTGQMLDDTMLTSRIRSELIKDPDIRYTNVDVDTVNNTVTVTGMVSSAAEKQRVLTIVHKVAGGRTVVDNILVN